MSAPPKWWTPHLPPQIEVQLYDDEYQRIRRELKKRHLAGKISTNSIVGSLSEGVYHDVTFFARSPEDLPIVARVIAKVLKARAEVQS